MSRARAPEMMRTPRSRSGGLLLLLGSVLFVVFGFYMERTSIVSMIDFKAVYCGARALLHHTDPYNPAVLRGVYLAEAQGLPSNPHSIELSVTRYIYPPTTFALTLTFALLPWGPAHLLWITATAGTLILAAFLMWTVAAPRAPVASAFLLSLLLITSELLIEVGNAAGIVVALAVISTWCFLEDRFVPAGVLCLAIALLVKPHNAALIWLYFMFSGGESRKRALQTLGIVVALAIPLLLWTSAVSPHWLSEMNASLAAHALHGADSDPGPTGVIAWTHGAQLISLQTVLSLFWDEPRFYNPATWLLCGLLLLACV